MAKMFLGPGCKIAFLRLKCPVNPMENLCCGVIIEHKFYIVKGFLTEIVYEFSFNPLYPPPSKEGLGEFPGRSAERPYRDTP